MNHGFCPRARKGNPHSATLEQSNNTSSPMLRRGMGRGVRLLYTKDTSCIRVYFMVSGLWSLVSGLWSLVSGLWSLVSGLWSLVFGLWSLVSGLWSLVSGLWSLVSGLWSLVSGLWSLVFGLWSLVFGLWSLVSGLWSLVSIAPSISFFFFQYNRMRQLDKSSKVQFTNVHLWRKYNSKTLEMSKA